MDADDTGTALFNACVRTRRPRSHELESTKKAAGPEVETCRGDLCGSGPEIDRPENVI